MNSKGLFLRGGYKVGVGIREFGSSPPTIPNLHYGRELHLENSSPLQGWCVLNGGGGRLLLGFKCGSLHRSEAIW